MTSRVARSRGFAIADATAIVFCIAMVGGLSGGAIDRATEASRRVKCASNLRQIGQALLLYGNENKGAYPATRRNRNLGGDPVFFPSWNAADPMKDDGPEINDVTAGLFLLLRTQDIEPWVFRCPSTDHTPLVFGNAAVSDKKPVAKSPQEISNFPGPEYLSYSYGNPYPGVDAVGRGFKFNTSLPAEFAVASDLNPGGDVLALATPAMCPPADMSHENDGDAWRTELTEKQKVLNSPNHKGEGQNVLYADGRVLWQLTPFSGLPRPDGARDNIFTRHLVDAPKNESGDPILGPPMDAFDSVLLPTATAAKPK